MVFVHGGSQYLLHAGRLVASGVDLSGGLPTFQADDATWNRLVTAYGAPVT